ncbi:hypothetical protein KY497_02550 [Microbacterium sp. PAMC22086]|nr:hypothetical protein KY497_02550 [Microbacterium sp. PAMC22086]
MLIIARIRRLLILAVIAALVYPALMVASRATCPGGIDGSGALVAVAIVVSRVWFFLIPMEGFAPGSWTVFSPFPFGNIDVTTTPMTTE